MKSCCIWTWSVLALVWLLAIEARGIDCIEYPLYDDDMDCLWDANYIPDKASCPGTEEYVWESDNTPIDAPQDCPGGCLGRVKSARLIPKGKTLKARFPGETRFTEIPRKNILKSKGKQKTYHTMDAVVGTTAFYVSVKSAGNPITVKVFAVTLDFSKAGLDPSDYDLKRPVHFGVEVTNVPNSVASGEFDFTDAAHPLTVTPIGSPATDYPNEGTIKFGTDIYRIITISPLFN